MKKSTLAIAALITTLSTAIIMPAAYADDMDTTTASPAPMVSPAPDATPTPGATTTPDVDATPATTDDESGS